MQQPGHGIHDRRQGHWGIHHERVPQCHRPEHGGTPGGHDGERTRHHGPDGLITAYSDYTNVNRLGPGNVILDGAASNVQIIEAGTVDPVTLGSVGGVTNINTLKVAQGTLGPAVIDPGVGESLRLGVTGGILLTPTSGALTIGAGANDGILTAGGNAVDVAGSINFVNHSANALTVNSVIANNGTALVSITKDGPGLLVLNGTNTFTGGAALLEGTLRATTSGALGTGPLTLVGGELQLAADANTTFGRPTTVAGDTTIIVDRLLAGAGVTHTLNTLSWSGGNHTLNVQKGSNVTSGTVGMNFNGVLSMGGYTGTMNVGTDVVLTLSGSTGSVGVSGNIIKSGMGTLVISGGNSYWEGGRVTLSEGTLDLRNGSALGDNIPLNQPVMAADGPLCA